MAMPAVDGAVRNLRKVQDHINNGMNDIMEVATNMGQMQEPGGDACMGNMAALEKVMLEYASMERTLKQFTEAVRSVKSQVQKSEDSNVEVQAMLDTAFQDLQRGNSSAELQEHPKLKEFQSRREELLEGLQEDGVGSSAADQSLGEEDLVMTQAELGTKCPFTQQEMTQPLRNLICGHHYDRQTIDELLTNRQKKIRCPLPGCTNTKPIHPNDLQSDSDFRRQIERQRRAKKRKMADTMTQ